MEKTGVVVFVAMVVYDAAFYVAVAGYGVVRIGTATWENSRGLREYAVGVWRHRSHHHHHHRGIM